MSVLQDKPKGYILCAECKLHFANRYCETCEERFCIDCYMQQHKVAPREGRREDAEKDAAKDAEKETEGGRGRGREAEG